MIRVRKSRKWRRCDECGALIRPGDKYVVIFPRPPFPRTPPRSFDQLCLECAEAYGLIEDLIRL